MTRVPDQRLLTYYFLASLLLGPFFLFGLVPYYFRYRSLRYHLDAEGITMRWGILFRREISLNYSRIQDIHLSSNVIERWLGLAKIQVQTASGNAAAEMTIEGLPEYEEIRDFLYSRMRGARDSNAGTAVLSAAPPPPGDPAAELEAILRQTAAEVHALRQTLARQAPERVRDA